MPMENRTEKMWKMTNEMPFSMENRRADGKPNGNNVVFFIIIFAIIMSKNYYNNIIPCLKTDGKIMHLMSENLLYYYFSFNLIIISPSNAFIIN